MLLVFGRVLPPLQASLSQHSRLRTSAINDLQPQPKALSYLMLPLFQQRTREGNDENEVCYPPSHELGDHKAGLYHFSKVYAISQREPDAAPVESPRGGYELVPLTTEMSELYSEQRMWTKHLFEEERLMVD